MRASPAEKASPARGAALLAALLALAGLPFLAPAAWACGPQTDCAVTDAAGKQLGVYRFRAPPGVGEAAAPRLRPGLIFIHGWRETAAGVMANKTLAKLTAQYGVALAAPQGIGRTWSYPGSPSHDRDEFAFFDALREDLVRNHGVDPNRILVSGFSMGGSMAWNIACREGARYWGFAAFSGAFWDPIPAHCPSPPRRLYQIHGTTDRTVPIGGRPIGASFHQSDVWDSFTAMMQGMHMRRSNGENGDGMTCARWSDAPEAAAEPAEAKTAEAKTEAHSETTEPEAKPAETASETAAEPTDEGSGTETQTAAYSFCRHGGGHWWRPEWLKPALEQLSQG